MVKLSKNVFLTLIRFILICSQKILLGGCATLTSQNDNKNEGNKTIASWNPFVPYSIRAPALEELCHNGEPLEYGACIVQGYRAHILPRKEVTIFVMVNNQNINHVNDKLGTYIMNVEIQMYWSDPDVRTKFQHGQDYIPLSTRAIGKIWTPDIFVSNLADYRIFKDSQRVESIKVRPSNSSKLFEEKEDTILESIISFRASVNCQFNFTHYPKDESRCNFEFGSQYHNIRFIFIQGNAPNNRSITGLHECSMSLSNTTLLDKSTFKNQISIDIHIKRTIRPFLYRYYLPCIGATIISAFSILIPPTLVQARVTLSVTVILMVVNLYVLQMVSLDIGNIDRAHIKCKMKKSTQMCKLTPLISFQNVIPPQLIGLDDLSMFVLISLGFMSLTLVQTCLVELTGR